MLSFRGRHWQERSANAPRISVPAHVADAVAVLRAIEKHGLLPAASFSDAALLLQRLTRACERKENVGVFGDYDCDGVTSAALWTRALRRRGIDPVVRLPHRIHDGYGVREKHIEEFAAQGVTLLLTVDTGVTAHAAAAIAKEKGIDLCIVDHHHVSDTMPHAVAIAHPARASALSAPPSAATLSFALIDEWEGGAWTDRDTDLALATMGTVADVMPLIGSNRALVIEGLAALSRISEGPVSELLKLSGIEGKCTARDIAFGLAPRINAAGRMDDPALALRALLDGGQPMEDLCTLNLQRQSEVERHMESLLRETGIAQNEDGVIPSPFLFAISEDYTPGIVGLLAGRLTERSGKPSLVGSVRGDTVTASLRSPPSYSIVEALDRTSSLLLAHGGHAQAAGCTFSLSAAQALEQAMLHDVMKQTDVASLVPLSYFDCALASVKGLTTDDVRRMAALEPFGVGNPEPCVLLQGVQLTAPRRVGGEGAHLQAQVDGIQSIGFRLGEFFEHLDQPLDVLCTLSTNTWNGRTTPQLVIEDLRVSL